MRKIIVAPDSFKGSLDSPHVAVAMEEGIRRVLPDIEVAKIPLADGGEGTTKILVEATGGKIIEKGVTGPLGDKVDSFFGILGDGTTAIVEMAAASGLILVPHDKRNPAITTTYGTGELIKAALDYKCKKIIVGIGGSATNDGGVGMAQALGVKFLDKSGKDIGQGGIQLKKLKKIDVSGIDERIKETEVVVASDVSNPLCGKEGASFIYAPQKGATADMIKELDSSLEYYSMMIKEWLGKDVKNIPGSGAAGGLGAGLIAFLNAHLRLGIAIILEAVKFEKHLMDSDLVISGEGKLDSQLIYGKVLMGVAKLTKLYEVPLIAICGQIFDDARIGYDYGIDGMLSIIRYPIDLKEAISKAKDLIADATEQAIRLIEVGAKLERRTW